jgi:hypothetical protein
MFVAKIKYLSGFGSWFMVTGSWFRVTGGYKSQIADCWLEVRVLLTF